MTVWRYFAHGIASGAQYQLFVGALSFLVLMYRKTVYVSTVGVVKETRTWRTNHRDILAWGDVKFVTIMYRGKQAMVFLERDTLGWKVLFNKDQIPALKKLFAEYIPNIDIDEVDR